ncbi:aspartate aminotransferase family protein [Phenylobacterium sp. SCN 70-31]|uniref:aspartate aminotransferase family protein n=1 Tax=Phenylobacterium sp. SCN 70-31 TaxID=1660129 RepID=UPI00086B6BA2|nr:aspartate aminotransferase family protein [Phenylobacterium sp. SCN 70-31]ODT86843.1 MAG: beta alanine--pyruvate aminotransferase [Phenylobacterium sp. SCN 70-31]
MAYDRDNRPDLANYWMPFTANRQFKADPRLVVAAKGVHYRTEDGREILDGQSGLWCVNAGHGRPEIAAAVNNQLLGLDYAPSFQMGHPIAFDFAQALAGIAPEGLDRIFFTNSGSESVDTALKIAFAYHRARGQGHRTRIVGRERGYHGVGFGGISAGGLVANRKTFPLLAADHIRHTHDPARNAFARGLPPHGAERADDLEQLVALHGDTLAAVIVEPVAGSAGVLPPPVGYLQRLREICDRHGVLLIFDEVITGFGRLGAPFAGQYFGVTPDLMTTAKGITNGVLPMGAVFVRRELHDTVLGAAEAPMEFFHGYTYSGHPVACAAGLATLDIYRREGLLTRVGDLADLWADAVHSLRGAPFVVDIRNIGLMAGIDLAPRDGAPGARGYAAMVAAFEAGAMIRATGDTLALAPPLIVQPAEIERLVEIVRGVISALD